MSSSFSIHCTIYICSHARCGLDSPKECKEFAINFLFISYLPISRKSLRTHIISAHRLPKSSSISLRLPKSISVVPTLTTQKTIKGGPKIIRCTKCKKLFDKQIHLTSHMKYAHPEVWKCDLCDKLFTDEGSLRVHETNIHHVKPYQCSECQKRFSLPFQVRINQFPQCVKWS